MKVLVGSSLLVCGCGGLAVSLLGSSTVTSSLMMLDGADLSTGMIAASVVALVGGLYTFITG